MKIFKNGEVMTFSCKTCGCKYVEGINKIDNLGFYYRTFCPDCGDEVRPDVILQEEDLNNVKPDQGYAE